MEAIEISTALSTAVALCAVVWGAFATRAWHRYRRDYLSEHETKPPKKLSELELDVADLLDQVGSLRASFKKMNSRLAMRDAREKLANGHDAGGDNNPWAQRDGESTAEWKARMRRGPLLRGQRPQGSE